MRLKSKFTSVCLASLLISCQNTIGPSPGSSEDGETIANLIEHKAGSHIE